MTSDEIERVGDTAPTIDRILIGEFTDHEKRREWLQANAPAFSVIRPECGERDSEIMPLA